MKSKGRYRRFDFVDYFAAMTPIQTSWVMKFTNDSGCLAALDAFFHDKVILGCGAQFVEEQLSAHPMVCLALLKQLARRHNLPTTDARHVRISSEAHAEQERRSALGFWGQERRPKGWSLFRSGDETEKDYRAILHDNRREYGEFWKISNRQEYESLLEDLELLTMIDAFNNRKDDLEPWDHVAQLARFGERHLSSAEARVRDYLLAQFGSHVERGLIEIPPNLKELYPKVYADRGIPRHDEAW
jgi:hypothetical protein